MKNFLLTISFLVIYQVGFGQYCLPVVTGAGGGISNVSLNTLNNNSPLAQGYVDFSASNVVPDLIKTNTEQIQITTTAFQFFEVWIDWNQDLVFGAGENVPFTAGSGVVTLNINVPLGAVLGNTRMRVQSRTSFGGGGPCTTAQGDGDIEDYTVNIIELPMQVDSLYTSQVTYGCFPNDVVDKMVIRVDVEISYSVNPLVLTSLTFNTVGSSNALNDISNARLYQTNSVVFSKNNPFGGVVLSPNGSFNFVGSYNLSPGTNYFWLTYDITPNAVVSNQIEAQLDQSVIDGVTYVPSTSSLIFSQPINDRSNYRRKEANIWYPDKNVGIDFNCLTPVVINNQHAQFSNSATEGTGSICRVNGDLLFYADGNKIYNRVHEIMPNGTGIMSNSSKTAGLLIPRPGSTTNFYLITPSGQGTNQDTLTYSEINLTLDNGFGDIIPTQKNIMIMPDPFNEAVAIIDHCNGQDVWLCVPRNNTNEIHSFLITSAGINTTPVISTGVGFPTYTNIARGTVKFSPNGKWLVVTNQLSTSVVGDPYLFEFDNSTGIVSNPTALNTNDRHAASFSPDNSKLFMNSGNTLYQYDLCNVNISSSRTFIGNVPGNTLWLLQNAPDGKIYMDPGGNATAYSVINNPNNLGAACNFVPNGFSLSPYNHQSTLKFVSSYNESIFNQSILDSTVVGFNMSSNSICQYSTVNFSDTSIMTPGCASNALLPRTYFWDFGDPSSGAANSSTNQNESHTYNSPGTYTIKFAVTEECQSDTIIKTLTVIPVDSIIINTIICSNDSVLIGANYENSTGIYIQNLTSVIGGCDSVITTNLTVNLVPVNNINTSICQGDSVLLSGFYQSVGGVYNDTIFGGTSAGCDSIITTTLTVNPIFTTPLNQSICQSDSILIGSNYFNTAGIYDDTLSSMLGCDSIIQITLTINSVGSSNITTIICQGDSVLVGGSYQTIAGIYTDTISNGGSNGCDSIVNTTLTINPIAFSTINLSICEGDSVLISGNYEFISGTYNDTISNGSANGCDSIVSTVLSVNPLAGASINLSVNNYCLNDNPLTFNAQNSGGIWSGNGITDTANGVFNPNSAGVGNHQIIYSIAGSCGDADTVNIDIYANPTISFITTDDNCGQASGLIEVAVETGINPIIFNWDTGETTQNLTNLTEGVYTIIVADSSGCNVSEQITVSDLQTDCEYHIYLPNAFTPNQDGENDILFLRGKGIKEFTLVIYNRWGNKVFETSDLSYGWDGTYKGNTLNPAVFVYVIDVTFDNGEKASEKGNVSIIK